MQDHLKKCSNRKFQCSQKDCKFEGKKEDFVNHVVESHKSMLIECFDLSLIPKEEEKKEGPSQQVSNHDRIATMRNSAGNKARLGQTGKYYCGGRLDTKCGCCDGSCGPTNGCNCRACMALDLQSRQLPKGYLVNKEGRTVRRGVQDKFYCGSKVLSGFPGCDGWCGPTNGP
jgi:hypothetical protein